MKLNICVLCILIACSAISLGGDAHGDLLKKIQIVEPADSDLDQWYQSLATWDVVIPQACRQGSDSLPTPGELRKFESRLAAYVRQNFEIGSEEPSQDEEFRSRAIAHLYRQALRGSVEIEDEAIASAIDEYPELASRPSVMNFDYFFLPLDGEASEEAPEELIHLSSMAAGESTMEEMKIWAIANEVVFSERPIRAVSGSMNEALEQAVVDAGPGQWSEIISGHNGWHLLYVHSYRPGYDRDSPEATAAVRRRLRQEAVAELRQSIRDTLSSGSSVDGSRVENPAQLSLDSELVFAEALFEDRPELVESAMRILRDHQTVYHFWNFLLREVEIEEEKLLHEYGVNSENYRLPDTYQVVEMRVPFPDREAFDSVADFQVALTVMRRQLLEWGASVAEDGLTITEGLEILGGNFESRIIDLGTAPLGPRGAMVDRAIQNLSSGEVSIPVSGENHYHIFQVVERSRGEVPPFEVARDHVLHHLRQSLAFEEYSAVACYIMQQ